MDENSRPAVPIDESPEDWRPGRLSFDELQREYARLRTSCPVAHTSEHGGYWTLSRYADVRRAAMDPFSYRSERPFVASPVVERFIPLTLNPPEHQKYRKLLNPYFAAARIETLEPVIRGYAREHLAPLIAAGGGDFHEAVAYPLPARALCAFLSFPDEIWADLKELSRGRIVNRRDEAALAGLGDRFRAHVTAVVAERTARPLDPEQDLFSGLLAARVDGEPLPVSDVIDIGYQLLAAGHDTSTAALASAVYLLATNVDQQERMRVDRALLPTAIEEVFRLEPPLHNLGRTLAKDVELHDRTLPAGSTVALSWAAANRDGDQFPEPDTFDPARSPNRHLTMGQGLHMCLGAPLARLELRVTLDELLSAGSSVELDGSARRSGITTAGFDALPIRIVA